MDTIIAKISLSYDRPIDHRQLQQLHDQFYGLLDAEVNDGELALEDAEVMDFSVELERSED